MPDNDLESTTDGSEILVGVDGSDSSKQALAWAARQAKLSGAPLHVVIVWDYPMYFGSAAPWPGNIDLEADAKSMLDKTIEEVGLLDDSSIELRKSVVFGSPALVLNDLSKGAALVVVGSRGHGEFAGMLLGSVSEQLATHASCPVLILRDHAHQPHIS